MLLSQWKKISCNAITTLYKIVFINAFNQKPSMSPCHASIYYFQMYLLTVIGLFSLCLGWWMVMDCSNETQREQHACLFAILACDVIHNKSTGIVTMGDTQGVGVPIFTFSIMSVVLLKQWFDLFLDLFSKRKKCMMMMLLDRFHWFINMQCHTSVL